MPVAAVEADQPSWAIMTSVAFAGVDGIEGEAGVIHVFAFGRDLAAEHYPRTFVSLVFLCGNYVSEDTGNKHSDCKIVSYLERIWLTIYDSRFTT